MKKLVSVICLVGIAAFSSAQSRNSFLGVTTITGVSFVNTGGNTYRLSVLAGASFTYNNTVYVIRDVFGVWALNNSNTGLNASAGSQNGWGYDEGTNPDDIAGWKTNPPNALANGSLDFTYSSITQPNIDQVGFHVRLLNQNFPNTSGGTGYVTAANPVPEPATMAVLGVGVAALIRRKRK